MESLTVHKYSGESRLTGDEYVKELRFLGIFVFGEFLLTREPNISIKYYRDCITNTINSTNIRLNSKSFIL
jgi:hypothetical protein